MGEEKASLKGAHILFIYKCLGNVRVTILVRRRILSLFTDIAVL